MPACQVSVHGLEWALLVFPCAQPSPAIPLTPGVRVPFPALQLLVFLAQESFVPTGPFQLPSGNSLHVSTTWVTATGSFFKFQLPSGNSLHVSILPSPSCGGNHRFQLPSGNSPHVSQQADVLPRPSIVSIALRQLSSC